MAFRILTPDELALLTDRQRENYEEELALYQERVKLVEQLEKFENTVIPPYKPVLGKFSPVKKAPARAFAVPEHTVIAPDTKITCAPGISRIRKPYLDIRLPEHMMSPLSATDPSRLPVALPPMKPLMPFVPTAVAPEAKPAPNPQTKPVLTQSGKIAAPVLQANIPPVKCSLPQNQLAKAPEAKAFAPVSTNAVTVKAPAAPAIPQVGTPHMDPPKAQLPTTSQPGAPGATFAWESSGKPSLPAGKPVKMHTGTYCPPDAPKANIPTASGISLPKPITISQSVSEAHVPSPAVCDAPGVNFQGIPRCEPSLPAARRAVAPDVSSYGAIQKLLQKNTHE